MSTSHVGLGLANTNFTAPAAFIAWNWFQAYCVLASRSWKQYYGMDNNASPRQDLKKYGDIAVREGKLTQAQLDQIHRVEAASANSTEGFILFTASVLFALVTNVPSETLKSACWVYSIMRVCYGAIYVFTSDNKVSQLRGITWWISNASCMYLLYKGAQQGA